MATLPEPATCAIHYSPEHLQVMLVLIRTQPDPRSNTFSADRERRTYICGADRQASYEDDYNSPRIPPCHERLPVLNCGAGFLHC